MASTTTSGIYFLPVLEARDLRVRCRQGWFLERHLPRFVDSSLLPESWDGPSSVHTPREKSLPFLIRTPVLLDSGPTLWLHLTFSPSPKPLSPNTVTLGLQHMNVGGGTFQSIIPLNGSAPLAPFNSSHGLWLGSVLPPGLSTCWEKPRMLFPVTPCSACLPPAPSPS